MTLGYQFINGNGYPVGGVQPTMEDAEVVALFHEVGRFYSVEQNEFGQIWMRFCYSKGMA